MRSRKKILLLGGGHANIQVLHQLARLDRSGFNVTLVSDTSFSPYSGMIPSYMAGVYEPWQLHFDLKKICLKFGFEYIEQRVQEIDAPQNQIRTAEGQIIHYDICSVNLGIQPSVIANELGEQPDVIYLKPISKLIAKWNEINKIAQLTNKNLDFSVIGGGAAAFEIAVACRRYFSDAKHKVKIITGNHTLLHEQNERTKKFAYKSLKQQGIDLIENARVVKIKKDHLVLSDGRQISRQICLIGTSAQASDIFRRSNLPINSEGFVRVHSDLRVEGFRNIFAAGDCCFFSPQPLPKAGVFAVRQGPILFANISALINDSSKLISYKPQKNFLTILVSGENQAIASYRQYAFQGFLAWNLKDFIDLRFMKRFQ